MAEKNEIINIFAKKGFLLDRESLDFFVKFDNIQISEDILKIIHLITNARVISKKVLLEHYNEIKAFFISLDLEKTNLVNTFFSGHTIIQEKPKEEPRKIEEKEQNVKILYSNIIPYNRIEVKDFVSHFKNRYNFFKDILRDRKELDGLVSINKIGNNKSFSLIGLVSNKRVTKNKNIIVEIEDLTGKINVLISQEKEMLMNKAKEIILDDVIGVKCSGARDFVYANDVIFPDSYAIEKKKCEQEAYALFISDIHLGSKFFLKEKFERFLAWINGVDVDEATREKVKKIKYIFVAGDNVDGVGIYPGQEPLLEIKDMKEQYKKLAEYFKKIPENVDIIMCPGQHDAVRVPEPQPAIDSEFAPELVDMKNVYLVSNPAMIEIACSEKKKGLRVMMYHGASMIRTWMDQIEDLRLGQAHLNPSKIVKYMLRHRHLSPTHSSNVYVPSEKEDMTLIKEVPDIIVTGDLHKADVDMYNNILIICGSCWQSATPFEEKVGNHPDPCKVPMLNLKTREIKILDFS